MYPPQHQGGYELTWLSSTRDLLAAGHEVRVLTTDVRLSDAATEEHDGVHRELRWYWKDYAWPPQTLGSRVRIERHNAAVYAAIWTSSRPTPWPSGRWAGCRSASSSRYGAPASPPWEWWATTGWSTARRWTPGPGCTRAGAGSPPSGRTAAAHTLRPRPRGAMALQQRDHPLASTRHGRLAPARATWCTPAWSTTSSLLLPRARVAQAAAVPRPHRPA